LANTRLQSAVLSGGLLVLATVACAGASAGTIPLEVGLRARLLAPGEPLRVVVRAPVPMASVRATFLGHGIFMVRTRTLTEGDLSLELWSGWTLIGLDQGSGQAVLEVSGTTQAGREAAGTRAVSIQSKQFPVEELSVAPKFVTPPPEVEKRLQRERRKLSGLYKRRNSLPPPEGSFGRPVPGQPSSAFGTRRMFNGKPRSPHPGLDLRAGTGTPVSAAGSGIVVLAEDLYYSGNTVILDHGGGLFTLYAHLSEIRVEEGQEVRKEQVVALSGATGRVTGPHLHWGAKIGNRPFDPMALLDEALFE